MEITPTLALNPRTTEPDLILDRAVMLEGGRVAGVNDGDH
jgi:hypothetical protein